MGVIITGAGGGLGRSVCQAFVDRGISVIGVEKNWTEPMPFPTVSADLTTSTGCAAMLEESLKHGPAEALVHLVGGFGGGSPIAETGEETWDQMMNLNLRVAFLTMRAVLKPMLAAGRGRIVAIGSRAAVEPSPNFAAYAISKAALVALVKNVAAETKDSGITANILLPSTIDTAANRRAMPKADFSKWVAPESMARLIVWLASPEAGDVSGAVIPIYGKA
jgi:NAD(P)-dependent dehydrogenase (short-subunit alcohol dehydrogenase family)